MAVTDIEFVCLFVWLFTASGLWSRPWQGPLGQWNKSFPLPLPSPEDKQVGQEPGKTSLSSKLLSGFFLPFSLFDSGHKRNKPKTLLKRLLRTVRRLAETCYVSGVTWTSNKNLNVSWNLSYFSLAWSVNQSISLLCCLSLSKRFGWEYKGP